jgi:hypothetical protein
VFEYFGNSLLIDFFGQLIQVMLISKLIDLQELIFGHFLPFLKIKGPLIGDLNLSHLIILNLLEDKLLNG